MGYFWEDVTAAWQNLSRSIAIVEALGSVRATMRCLVTKAGVHFKANFYSSPHKPLTFSLLVSDIRNEETFLGQAKSPPCTSQMQLAVFI